MISIKVYYSLLYFFIPLFCSITCEWNTKDYFKREHSLIKPYQGSGTTIPYWDFVGSTIVTPSYIRLTPDVQSKQGGLWNSVPCQIRNWELQVQFKVHGHGRDLFGDGFAIWYVRDRMRLGSVFGSPDYFYGLVILLDTYSNHNGDHGHQHPYISAMVNNGTLHYDHDRDGTHTQLAGCDAKFRNSNTDTYISIRYESDVLTVYTDLDGKAAWKECFSVKGVKLPTGYYFGMSAATGDLSDNHDISTIRFYELESGVESTEDRSAILPAAMSFEPPREHVPDVKPMSGLKIFFLVLLGVIGFMILVICGIMLYSKYSQDKKKRFY